LDDVGIEETGDARKATKVKTPGGTSGLNSTFAQSEFTISIEPLQRRAFWLRSKTQGT
jgi:hypothetical protein